MTALGIDNYGRMTYRYGYEEIDYVDGTSDWVWNCPQHTLFLRIRELFDVELCELYTRLESLGCWSATSLINQFNEWQMQFPEELWRTDIFRKYIRTFTSSFINGEAKPEFLRERANGRKKTQRSQFEKNQEKYMASKFGGTTASADDIILRCSVPNTTLAVQPNFDITLTPYSYIYLNVKYNTSPPLRVRAIPNETYTIEYDSDLADIIEIYSASCMKSIGDLSACYLTNGDFANASKIRELILGNNTEGYNNTNVMTLGLGANTLLNKLDIQNMSGLTHALDLTALKNLEELYAHGSNIGGVTFADGGLIEIAELPAINAMIMKNLMYLVNLDVISFNKLTSLTVENCNTVDLVNVLDNAPNVNRVRIVGIDWTLENTSLLERLYEMSGFDRDGYNTDQSVLTGTVSVPTIGQYDLDKYKDAWSDLTVIPRDGLTPQYKVTFKNHDGTILDEQYVLQYGNAADPINREDNPIVTPTKESTVQYSYAFTGWDRLFTNIVDDIDVYAEFKPSLREYTIQYVSMGTPVYTTVGKYGENIVYNDIPTYTMGEPTTFYLFDRWDKSGLLTEGKNGDDLVNGVKTVTAIFDSFNGNSNFFTDKNLSNLTPVQIYAMNKLGLASSVIQQDSPTGTNSLTIPLGNDIEFDDVVSELLVDNQVYLRTKESTYFDGTNHIDTGIQLFDEDKDFVLAIDYEFLSGNTPNSTLVQCHKASALGNSGFKLIYNKIEDNTNKYDGVQIQLDAVLNGNTASTSNNIVPVNKREVIVIRHAKNDNNLYIYKSNFDGDDVEMIPLFVSGAVSNYATLVFGAAVPQEGVYSNKSKGIIHWAKIWYIDLDKGLDFENKQEDWEKSTCRNLALWNHETVTLDACGFSQYYLADNPERMCSFNMLASHLLYRTMQWNSGTTTTNDGGWKESHLNRILNERLYNAIPQGYKSLLKKVFIRSNDGISDGTKQYTAVTSSECYIAIPSVVEVDNSKNYTPYSSEGSTFWNMNGNHSRRRTFSNGEYSGYWLRSPAPVNGSLTYADYVWRVDEDNNNYLGQTNAITSTTRSLGVLIVLSF